MGNSKWPLAPALKQKIASYIGKEVVCGIRPEHIRLTEGDGHATVTVRVCEHLGSENLVYFSLNGTNTIAKVSGESFVQAGEEVTVSLQIDKIHLFDKTSQQRIG